jgi:hypothetical protein
MLMRNCIRFAGLLGVLLASSADPAELPAISQGDAKIKLRVLYAGVPGDARTVEFVAFLEKHFTKVGQASYSQFQPKMADGYDVVLFDAEPKPTPGHIGLPSSPNLPEDYDRASVLIAGAGVLAVRQLQTKIDWL